MKGTGHAQNSWHEHGACTWGRNQIKKRKEKSFPSILTRRALTVGNAYKNLF